MLTSRVRGVFRPEATYTFWATETVAQKILRKDVHETYVRFSVCSRSLGMARLESPLQFRTQDQVSEGPTGGSIQGGTTEIAQAAIPGPVTGRLPAIAAAPTG